MLNRRDFLTSSFRCSTLLALAPTVPTFLERTTRAADPDRDGRVLVVVELNGGNDGINTVVPFRDLGYARARPTLRLPVDRLLKLNDDLGLNPAMTRMNRLWDEGALAIVQGVGYPNPSRSHFESGLIWKTARLGRGSHGSLGWIGRGLDAAPRAADGCAAALFIGDESPSVALRGSRSTAASLDRPADLRLSAARPESPCSGVGDGELDSFVRRSLLDAYAFSGRMAEIVPRGGDGDGGYPATELGRRLRMIADLIRSGLGTRVYYTAQPGYDTHAIQLGSHNALLGDLSDSLWSFYRDLSSAGLADRVTVLSFSEFGRRVAENGGRGTDHGTAGPVFLVGAKVRPGLSGRTPSLTDLHDGDLEWSTDFRRVYATVLEGWLGLPAEAALGGVFGPMPLLRT
jgi:uncharacterized protein (DUF1501 family)